MKEQGPLVDGALHSVAVGVATALAAIHGAGVIHRDLKPANVLFALGSPKVIDFGIARALESTSEHTRTGHMVGTVAYMAPERLDGPDRPITPAVDVFAWGAVVAYAGTGRNPFAADSPMATAARILTAHPELGELTGPLRQAVERALAKDPDDRPTATELLDMLVGQSRADSPVSRAASRARAQRHIRPRHIGRRAAAAATGALTLTAAVVVGTINGWPGRGTQRPNAAGPDARQPSVQESLHPAPSTAVPSQPPTSEAPTNVRVTDKGDTLLLTWDAPIAGEGPVIISGGRTGHELRDFQQLPAGSARYEVYGLSKTENYCFTVGAVTAAEKRDTSEEACTHRP
ncbi:hypothetical protein KRM28CT15_52820 [Krasilnikovia sp. M28-CT-15]